MGLLDGVMGNASKIDAAKIQDEFSRILAPGEVVDHAYQLIRDYFVFTNKRLVLATDAVRQAFEKRGVVLLRADWTNRDDEITRELARFNRNGVPLYVLYDSRGATQVLPELLTERIVLDALDRL